MIKSMTAHVGANLWLWVGISAVVTALAIYARATLGRGYYLGEIITVAAMVLGTLLILISQQGLVRPELIDDEA